MMWEIAIVALVSFALGAAAFCAGLVVGAYLVWSASGNKGKLRFKPKKEAKIEQEFTG